MGRLMVSRCLEEHLRRNYVKKISLRPLNIKNTRKFFKIVQKWPNLTFFIGRKTMKQKQL